MKKFFLLIIFLFITLLYTNRVNAQDASGCMYLQFIPGAGGLLSSECINNQVDIAKAQLANKRVFILFAQRYASSIQNDIKTINKLPNLTNDQKAQIQSINTEIENLNAIVTTLDGISVPITDNDQEIIKTLFDKQSEIEGMMLSLNGDNSDFPPQTKEYLEKTYDIRGEYLGLQLQVGNTIGIKPDILEVVNGASCGGIGSACCKLFKFNASNLQIPVIGDGIVGTIANRAVTTIYGFVAPLMRPLLGTVEPLINDVKGGRQCSVGYPVYDGPACTCIPNNKVELTEMCIKVTSPAEKTQCMECIDHGFWTSIGCVDFSFQKFLQEKVFGLGLAFGGIVAFGCIILSAFRLQFSQGDPKRIQKIRETLTSCILGLIMIIFAVFILRLIGVNILRIPGFI